MAHFAEIDSNNRVTRVLVTDNEDPAGDEGYSMLVNEFGGTWIKTSYNGNTRKNFAGVGMTYDSERDAFIPIKQFESWVLNEDTCQWEAPVAYPSDGQYYIWSEANKEWTLVN